MPNYISNTPLDLRSDYTAMDDNADMVFIYCDPVKVTDSIESAKKARDVAHERLYAKYSVDLSDIAKK